MIEKSKIKKGLIFWIDCEAVVQFPDSKNCIYIPARLMSIDNIIKKNNVAKCTLYDKKYFGAQTALTIDYIEKYTTEITLDDTDWQEMVDLCNTIYFEKAKEHDWLTKVPDCLKERVSNFLCRDFYLKYNLVKESNNETENKS